MNPNVPNVPNVHDAVTTLAGGGAGLSLLYQVRWEAIPYGECVRLITALALIAGGYLMYRRSKSDTMKAE